MLHRDQRPEWIGRLWLCGRLVLAQDLLRERDQIVIEMPADHVAQQRAQMIGHLQRERLGPAWATAVPAITACSSASACVTRSA